VRVCFEAPEKLIAVAPTPTFERHVRHRDSQVSRFCVHGPAHLESGGRGGFEEEQEEQARGMKMAGCWIISPSPQRSLLQQRQPRRAAAATDIEMRPAAAKPPTAFVIFSPSGHR
jgi:hypothetical protein